MKTAIVLSGGGAKGAYEIGVWRALIELKIPYQIVTGTSIGALNGVFMVQKDFKKAQALWRKLNFSIIFKDFEANYMTYEGKKKLLKQYASGILLHGGVDTTEFESNIKKYINPDKFYGSDIDYGLVTFDFTNLKPHELIKEEIPRDLLKDYLMASATCFPAFKKKKIGDSEFIDGGYYDNIPINLAIRLGAKKVIAVNVGAPGNLQPLIDESVEITMIEPRNNIGTFLILDERLSKRAQILGYNDTMKTFKKYDGYKFTFKKNHIKRVTRKRFNQIIDKLNDEISREVIASIPYLNRIVSMEDEDLKESFMLEILEDLGNLLELEETKVYSYRQFEQCLFSKLKHLKVKIPNTLTSKLLIDELKKLSHSKRLISYLYQKITTKESEHDYYFIKIVAKFFPREFIEALYLSLLK